MANEAEILHAQMHGIHFGSANSGKREESNKIKNKARGKAYHTGEHNSGSAKHKKEIRQRVKNRRSQRKG